MNQTRAKRRRRKILIARLKLCAVLTLVIALVTVVAVKLSGRNNAQEAMNTLPSAAETTIFTTQAPKGPPWNLVLVNSENPIPEERSLTLTTFENDLRIDSRIYAEVTRMMNDCRSAGLLPLIVEAYRTQEEQQSIFDERVTAYVAEGYAKDEASRIVSEQVATPGFSEHQLGLALDIDSENTKVCSNEAIWTWLAQNCTDYGFIIRYPDGKQSITGITYEPWHLRYVGKDAAIEITGSGLCLEEYIALKYPE